MNLDHVALVVVDLERSLRRAREAAPDVTVGPIEEFPAEGTREVYLGADGARLLLLQPIGATGPYARALARRGPGLHHVALAVPEPRAALADLPGWRVHPASGRTLWLCHPGVGTLVEVMSGAPTDGAPLVTRVECPCPADLAATLLAPLGLVAGAEGRLSIGATLLRAVDLAS
jgi:hypothetical protein